MPKLIFTSRYLRDAPPAQLENYVRYIGTREGVEKVDESRLSLPATVNQKNLIRQIIRDIPASKEMLEYADFLVKPTMGNASELISSALEQNIDFAGKRENYVDYIANRPRVERVGEHGLFTDAGQSVILAKVQGEVTSHKGPVWTHVISLRREDAARLGYDSAGQWMALLRSKRAMLCKHMKIDSRNLRWYAAFHNEGNHPHVHLMVYSARDNDGYLTEKSIEAMRSELAHDIFRQDFAHIYEEQNQARAVLKTGAADVMRELMDALQSGTLANPEIEKGMVRLSERLQNTGGKKIYGYLKRDVKNLIDEIVDELEKDSRIAALYQAWGSWQKEILMTYQKNAPPLPPLSSQPHFKSIKNMVITEALKLGGHHFTFEDEMMPEPPAEITPEQEEYLESHAKVIPEQETGQAFLTDAMPVRKEYRNTERVRGRRSGGNKWWNDQYKEARRNLYGDEELNPDFAEVFRLFLLEAESGNALAMHDLGRMFTDGLGREIDLSAAQEWYKKALEAFLSEEQSAEEKQRPYLQYRIGKMFASGLGTEQDYGKAALWFSKAVDAEHNLCNSNKFALYSLAGLYYRGQGVEQDYEQALYLYKYSANQGNPYADYELAKMYRNGIGTGKNTAQADAHFIKAFDGFFQSEAKSHDDKLQYRLGQMLHTGTGTEKDDAAAADYWERAAKLGNVNAQYALGKLWLENGSGNPERAVGWIAKAADAGNAAAQYALAKLYITGEDFPQDIARAVELFTKAANQKNEYAQYQLGKLYLAGEHLPMDMDAAIRWFTEAADQNNQFAQYVLGKLYLCGHDVPRDREKAVLFLQASAVQGNIYAQFFLDHLDSFRDPSAFLAATRLLHQIEGLFREDYRRATGSSHFYIDRKRRRKLAEKKQAQGHKWDDREPLQQPL